MDSNYINDGIKNVLKYIITFSIIVIIICGILVYFLKVFNSYDNEINLSVDYNMLNLYLLDIVNTPNTTVDNCGMISNDDEDSYYVRFVTDNNNYTTFMKKGRIIYFNDIKICEDVDEFKVVMDKSEKPILIVETIVGGEKYNMQYSINM